MKNYQYLVKSEYRGNSDYPDYEEIIKAESEEDAIEKAKQELGLMIFWSEPKAKLLKNDKNDKNDKINRIKIG